MELQDVVNRLRMKQSIKAIKRETGKHRSVIRKVLQLAEQEGWLMSSKSCRPSSNCRRYTTSSRARRRATSTRSMLTGSRSRGGARRTTASWRSTSCSKSGGVEYSETTVRRYM